MKLAFKIKNLIPSPLAEQNLSNSEIWDTEELQIDSSKRYLVSAHSGKGKTTFLSILNGTRTDYSGEAILNEKLLSDFTPKDWAQLRREHISFVSQTLSLFPNLTALENIQLKNQLTHFLEESQIVEMAKQLEVEHLLYKNTETLSLGQKQRIAIIRSLCQPFQLLLLDEPFSNLDNVNIEKASQLISTHCEMQNAGFILASLGEEYFFKYDEKLNL
ncbi:ATP-binding cassette domain-containing protein [Sediminitomix flava]|uniref:ABC-type lipoprotein export system ATPase subunit n=1 Tax=Sediminitomix flava TaxID=379075 RepID=A0A315YY99_SEDFL|nr:ATP-binding cassette domain-containing protein [Sediminitomix flava]PWJ33686.1 ABC-type lipoprotein export system ATPase subunit [Sediminitomix flava]